MSLNEFCRTELLIGEEGIEKLHNSKVIVFGMKCIQADSIF